MTTIKTTDGKHEIRFDSNKRYRGYFSVASYDILEDGSLEYHWAVGTFKTEAQAIRAAKRFAKSEFGCSLEA